MKCRDESGIYHRLARPAALTGPTTSNIPSIRRGEFEENQ